METEYRVLGLFIVIMLFYMLSFIVRLLKTKLLIVNRKLDALLVSTEANYPLMIHISQEAIVAIQNGDRNKAILLITKGCFCTNLQAESIIKEIEQKRFKE